LAVPSIPVKIGRPFRQVNPFVFTHAEEDQEAGLANQRRASKRKKSLHHRDSEITEKKIGTWVWPTNDELRSAGVVNIRPLNTLMFVHVVSRYILSSSLLFFKILPDLANGKD